MFYAKIQLHRRSEHIHFLRLHINYYLFQLAPFTCDVIHLIFTCCGADLMSDWNELLSDYYDYIKVPPFYHLNGFLVLNLKDYFRICRQFCTKFLISLVSWNFGCIFGILTHVFKGFKFIHHFQAKLQGLSAVLVIENFVLL